MGDQNGRNGRGGWLMPLTLSGGLVIAVFTGIMAAGEMRQRLTMVERCADQEQQRNRDQESRLIRLETIYDRTAQDIGDIKRMLEKK